LACLVTCIPSAKPASSLMVEGSRLCSGVPSRLREHSLCPVVPRTCQRVAGPLGQQSLRAAWRRAGVSRDDDEHRGGSSLQ
jgi:hypothetical protein